VRDGESSETSPDIAASMAVSSCVSSTGFCRKSHAPRLIVRTAIGMSPCPVRNTIGSVSLCSTEPLLELEPVHARHAQVEHDASHARVAATIDEFLRRCERFDVASRGAQHHRQRVADGFVVVDNENGRFAIHGAPVGSEKWKAVPPPGRLSCHSRPPCISRTERQDRQT
jgi:hypothetical protein